MKPSTDPIAGTMDEVEGKHKAGQVARDTRPQERGRLRIVSRRAQKKAGPGEATFERNTARQDGEVARAIHGPSGTGVLLPPAVGALALVGGLVLLAEEKK
jgi:hypothetical protein